LEFIFQKSLCIVFCGFCFPLACILKWCVGRLLFQWIKFVQFPPHCDSHSTKDVIEVNYKLGESTLWVAQLRHFHDICLKYTPKCVAFNFKFHIWCLGFIFWFKKFNVINIVRKNKFKRLNSRNNRYIYDICTIIKLISYFRLH